MKNFLTIDTAIILSNAKRVKDGRTIINSKKHLAKLIARRINVDEDNFYMQLYRAEVNGFISENEDLIKNICIELEAEKEDIILSGI